MGECLHGRESCVWILIHQFGDEIFRIVRDLTPDALVETPNAFFDLCEDLIIAPDKGRLPAKHNVKNHADTPNVALFGVGALEDFGGDVVRSSIHLMHRVLAAVVMMGRSKVDHFDLSVRDVDENVLRFEVAMSDLQFVTVSNRIQNLFGNCGRLLFAEKLPLRDLFEELAPVTQLSHQEDARPVFVDFVEAYDVGVV